MSGSPEELAVRIVEIAVRMGATGAECTVSEGEQFSAGVRMGEVETLTQAGSRGAGVRVMIGHRTGSAFTSDLSDEGVGQMIASAVDLAAITTEDAYAGLPDPADLGKIDTDLGLYSPTVAELAPEWKIEQARAAEAAAFAVDKRVANSEGASFDSHISSVAFANSLGFAGSYRASSVSLSAVPVVRDGESMQRDYWYSIARSADGLEPAADIGRRAAERALRRLGARKVPTQKVPIVFDPRVARSLVDNIFDAVSGDSVYRGESFLAEKLGARVAHENVTIIDDATIPGLFGSSPFDDEGVPSRRTMVLERGVLRSWLLNSYTARKLGMKTTGNASRGITGNAGVGHGNLYLQAGDKTPDAILKSVSKGFYVTELIGFGVNTVTGDYSRGAAGMWIENGELAFPVHEVTIASTLQEMLMRVAAVGNDLEFRGSVAAPTLLIEEMTVSGE